MYIISEWTVYNRNNFLFFQSADLHLVQKILATYLVLCKVINPARHLRIILIAICSRVNDVRLFVLFIFIYFLFLVYCCHCYYSLDKMFMCFLCLHCLALQALSFTHARPSLHLSVCSTFRYRSII